MSYTVTPALRVYLDNLSTKTNTPCENKQLHIAGVGDLETTNVTISQEMSTKEHPPHLHVPVLLEKTIELMQPQPGESYLDLTAGYGGHASAFLKRTQNFKDSVLVDRDDFAVQQLKHFEEKGTTILHTDFLSAATKFAEEDKKFDCIIADLGVSSPQLDTLERGFSFRGSAALDMRMDRRSTVTAAEIVNTYSKDELIRIITTYGEEPKPVARRIADAITKARPIETTNALAQTITEITRGPRKKIHPATRTFQALRIEVNDELGQIERMLPLLPALLRAKGKVGIISFHSLEDRLVKRYFAEQMASGYEAELDVLTKKPISGGDYDVHNPRSRSAKLRIAVKK